MEKRKHMVCLYGGIRCIIVSPEDGYPVFPVVSDIGNRYNRAADGMEIPDKLEKRIPLYRDLI